MDFQLSDVVGYYLLQPLATLLEGLDYADPSREHFLPPVVLEAGYAAASIPMALMALESFTHAAQYALHPTEPPKRVLQFVAKEYPESDYNQTLTELFVLRDAIVHGHMWRRKFGTGPDQVSGLRYGPWEMHAGFGDRKFHSLVDFSTNRTRVLSLNVMPSRLTSGDVGIVMRTMLNFLIFIEETVSRETSRNPESIVNIRNQRVLFRGRVVAFPDVVDAFDSGGST